MSKFFKALETAERERRQAAGAGPPEAPPAEAPRAAVVEPAPAPPAYGAPLTREASRPQGTWEALLLPPPPGEPGEVDEHLVSLLAPTSPAAEQYRALRLHVETLRRERGLRAVAVSSPGRGDGKTLSAINLAGALAQAPEARVVLVEADLRHPAVGRALGRPPGPGLASYLLDPAVSLEAVVERPPTGGFAVVLAGPPSAIPYELLKSPRLAALLAALRERYDYVVVDTPPVLPYPDVAILRDLVDGVVLVVRANHTPRETVRDALAALGPDRVLGVVFNDDARPAPLAAAAGWRAVLPRPRIA